MNLLKTVFDEARTFTSFLEKPIKPALLHELYNHLKWGPTSANSCPARFVFVTSPAGRDRLLPCISETNRAKVASAPCTAIIAYDSEFFELMPKLYPPADFKTIFKSNPPVALATARRNSALQGAYMMIAARALGLDCGPMSGFDAAALEMEFFADGRYKANFICNLGYGNKASLHPRNPRLDFDEACEIV